MFDPDDMFGVSKKSSEESSDESITADVVYLSKPVTYAYDAYQEKIDREVATSREPSRSNNGSHTHGGGGDGRGMGSSQRISLSTSIHAA